METALAVVGGAMLYKWFFGKSQKMLTNPSDVFQLCHAGSISWDRRSFSVRGKQTLLLSGEFQYWRVPDRERWRGLLQDYKGMGLNCIRVYFHWGYHSPAPNVYHFDGNRDVEFLLSLCAELHLHVIAAPGPYICAETSGGGFPMWLLQRPDIRIRHMNGAARKLFDPNFMTACRQWFSNILPLLAKHQVTRGGCIVLLQLENELLQAFGPYTFGLDAEISELVAMSREFGMEVPTFHNDCMDMGGFNPGGSSACSLDLYAFDRYPLIVPSPLDPHKPWSCATLSSAIDTTEKRLRDFGGAAASGPIFCAELQAGYHYRAAMHSPRARALTPNRWFSQWGEALHDDINDWFGPELTATLIMLYAAQGCTALNLYTPYGGTNHGSIADPDTYCSYDYSACIREYGFVSLRYRLARLALYQLHACSDILCNADQDSTHPYVSCQPPAALFGVRVCSQSQARILFVRNFHSAQSVDVSLRLIHRGHTIVSPLEIPHRACVTCVSNLLLRASGIRVVLSTLPILMRVQRDSADVLFLCAGAGGIVLDHLEGRQLEVHSDRPGTFTHTTSNGVLSLALCAGAVVTARCSGSADESPSRPCVIVCLGQQDALTFTCDGCDTAAWGPWHARINSDSVVAFAMDSSVTMKVFSPQALMFTERQLDFSSSLAPALQLRDQLLQLKWNHMPNVWALWPWQTAVGPLNDLQLGAAAGHIVYRYTFCLSAAKAVAFNISARHVMNMWVNGSHVAHKVAYSNPWRLASVNQAAGLITSILPSPLIWKAGYTCGNDNPREGSVSLTVRPPVVHEGSNELIIVVDNLGHQRQGLCHDDCRNPRGILSFSCSSDAVISNSHWSYAAHICANAANSIVTHGVPVNDVMQLLHAEDASNWKPVNQPARLESDGVHWFRASLSVPQSLLTAEKFPVPLRVSVSGAASCLLWVNRRPVGRLHTVLGPQTSLYVPDGFWRTDNEVLLMMCAPLFSRFRRRRVMAGTRYTSQAAPATIQIRLHAHDCCDLSSSSNGNLSGPAAAKSPEQSAGCQHGVEVRPFVVGCCTASTRLGSELQSAGGHE